MYAAPLDTGMGVGSELRCPYWFQNLHNSPLHNTVTKRKFIDFAPFRLILDKDFILRGRIGSSFKFHLQLPQVFHYYLVAFPFAVRRITRGKQKVFHRADTLEKIAFTFHRVCGSFFGSALLHRERSRLESPTDTLFGS